MKFLTAFMIGGLLSSSLTWARPQVIKVGAYEFPPYYELKDNSHTGLTPQTLRILNSMQKKYIFEPQILPPTQRYEFLKRKRIDMLFFEDPSWGWAKYPYQFVPLDVEDGEIYLTRKGGPPSPKNYEELKKMKLVVVKGFHYGFAGFETNESFLRKHFQIEIVENYKTCLEFLLAGKADVTLAAKSFIYEYLKKYPELQNRVVVSQNYDSNYKLGIIFSPTGRIEREKIEELVAELKKNPEYQGLIENRFILR